MGWGDVRIILTVGMMLGPALVVWWRHIRNDPPDADIMKGVLAWTALMLAFSITRNSETADNLREVCDALVREIAPRHADEFEALGEAPTACDPPEADDLAALLDD